MHPPSLYLTFAHPLAQTDRQEAFLRALKESEGTPLDGRVFLVFFLTLSLIVTVAYWYQNRPSTARTASDPRPAKPARRVLRNPRKLTREVAATLELSPADLRKLQHHAQSKGVQHPLTLLLCPSLVTRDKKEPEASDTPRAHQ